MITHVEDDHADPSNLLHQEASLQLPSEFPSLGTTLSCDLIVD
jgi:hypothetical protein